MNDLEERLRAALDARAQTFEASPHAWARVRARRPRRHRGRLLLAALPMALLAVFVPVLLNGGLGRNTAADPDAVYQRLMRERTAVGERLTVDDPAGGGPLRIWFAKAKLGYPEVCYAVERAAGEPYGGCSGVREQFPGGFDVSFMGSTLRDGAATAMDWGVASKDVGAVAGVTKSGQKITGTLVTPEGAPYQIWTVTYPAQDAMTMVEYADEQGRSLGKTSRHMLSEPLEPAMGAAVELADGVVARPHRTKDGVELDWLRHGARVAGSLVSTRDAPVSLSVNDDVVTGYARQDVTRVDVSFQAGTKTTLETRPDPWNLGVVLFAGANPADAPYKGYTAVAYDASGKEVWRHEELDQARREEGAQAIGPVMSLPGTENSGRPVRVWFVKHTGSPVAMCASGGVSAGTGNATWCASAEEGSFPVQAVTSYLPEPGNITHYGPTRDDWEWVEAVLSDGRRVRAEFLRGEGAPQRVWHVSVPLGAQVAGYTLKVRGQAARPIPGFTKACGRNVASSESDRLALSEGVAAYLSGACLAFWEDGEMVPSLPGPVPGGKLGDLLDARRPAYWSHGDRAWYGYAPAGTAKVVITFTAGASATAQAVPDPWGQGVTLFAGRTPKGADFGEVAVLKGYGADGNELWSGR